MDEQRALRGRVVESHRVASSAFRLAGVFGVVAAGWSVWVLVRGGSWWGPMHAFLAGTVLLSISGATQMFTITWAAAPPPRATVTSLQRRAVAAGTGLVLLGRASGRGWMVGIGAVFVLVGLVVLARALVGAVRRSLLRRFDLSSRFYLLALGAGTVGVSLGGWMGSGLAGSRIGSVRLVHAHLNLVGLVGLTIVGTLPTILPTFAHHRAVSGVEARYAWWIALGSVVVILGGLYGSDPLVGAGTLGAVASLVLITGGVVGRLKRRGLAGGLAYGHVVFGCVWLAGWAVTDSVGLFIGGGPALTREWIGAVVVAGIGQVLAGSLAYLLPVLAGRPPLLGRNLERTHRRPWVPRTLANLAGIGFLVYGPLAAAATGLWLVDFASRIVRMERPSRVPPAPPRGDGS